MKLRIRFSLRLFLIMFTIVAIVLGFQGHFVYRVKEQVRRHKNAIIELQSHGLLLYVPLSEEDIEDQTFFARFARKWIDRDAYTTITQCHLECLTAREAEQVLTASQGLYGWQDVQLELWKLDVPLLELLKRQPRLRRLRLNCRDIDPEAAARLGELTSIFSLTIRPPLTEEGAASLANLPHLQSLYIDASGLSAAGASHLGQLKSLNSLCLCDNPPTAEAVSAVLKNGSLGYLDITAKSLSEAALSELASAQSVIRLGVSDCDLPDSFCAQIAAMPNLQELILEPPWPLPPNGLNDLASAHSLREVALLTPDLENFELPGFTAPANLRVLEFGGGIKLADVELILASAPDCVIDARKRNVRSRNQSGTRFRLQDGVVESYDYVEHNGMPITPSPAAGPPPWKPVAE